LSALSVSASDTYAATSAAKASGLQPATAGVIRDRRFGNNQRLTESSGREASGEPLAAESGEMTGMLIVWTWLASGSSAR